MNYKTPFPPFGQALEPYQKPNPFPGLTFILKGVKRHKKELMHIFQVKTDFVFQGKKKKNKIFKKILEFFFWKIFLKKKNKLKKL